MAICVVHYMLPVLRYLYRTNKRWGHAPWAMPRSLCYLRLLVRRSSPHRGCAADRSSFRVSGVSARSGHVLINSLTLLSLLARQTLNTQAKENRQLLSSWTTKSRKWQRRGSANTSAIRANQVTVRKGNMEIGFLMNSHIFVFYQHELQIA